MKDRGGGGRGRKGRVEMERGKRRGGERGSGGKGVRREEAILPHPPHNTPTDPCCTWYKHSLSCNSKRSYNIIHTHKSCTKCLSPRLTHVGAMNMYT